MRRRRFVILDRDGTIIVERHYLCDPRQVELLPGAADGLRRLQRLGLGLVVITNQSAVGRGFIEQTHLDLIHQRLYQLLAAEGVRLDGLYVCPHLPEAGCPCRKPRTGLVELAAKELNFRPQASFVIGDQACDIELGRRVKATTMLVRTGYGAQVAAGHDVAPDYVVEDLRQAAQLIERLLAAEPRDNRESNIL